MIKKSVIITISSKKFGFRNKSTFILIWHFNAQAGFKRIREISLLSSRRRAQILCNNIIKPFFLMVDRWMGERYLKLLVKHRGVLL